ncbi:universal stress protein UspA-like protein [Bernardetia litoralis DSM 6794]|uniref:Universal stress protein UspA-like protein n=1 Tax=Bernardetia litoralis (strain ATCC 23117 / DSM 6794 / NBRC 15988 / NCIMB 1366 / Fx l1 / Sio-4) TaxID=880071 RepID=I4ANH4_BERLS|nr:universal stress protein [Bernardetia litoralis]AFM05509.1 universal stress protein UspA-like protein [Bernardetia litoralis DSM 6794]
MKTLLVPTNFSLSSAKSLQYSTLLAKEFGSKIIVHHTYPQNSPVHWLSDLENQLHAFVSEYDFEHYTGSEDYLKIETSIQQGREKENIINIIKKHDADILILSAKDRTQWEGIPFEMLISQTLEQTLSSVLIVPSEIEMQNSIKHVVFALSLDDGDADIIDSLLLFCEVLGAHLTCLHVSVSKEEKNLIDFQLQPLQETYFSISEEQMSFEITYNKSIEEGISKFLNVKPAQLLVMLTKERSFFEGLFHRSVSQGMSFQSKVPVMIVKL